MNYTFDIRLTVLGQFGNYFKKKSKKHNWDSFKVVNFPFESWGKEGHISTVVVTIVSQKTADNIRIYDSLHVKAQKQHVQVYVAQYCW